MAEHETDIIRRWIHLKGNSYISNELGDVLIDQNGMVGGVGGVFVINGRRVSRGTVTAQAAGTAIDVGPFDNDLYFFDAYGYNGSEPVKVNIGEASLGTKTDTFIYVYPAIDNTEVTYFAIGDPQTIHETAYQPASGSMSLSGSLSIAYMQPLLHLFSSINMHGYVRKLGYPESDFENGGMSMSGSLAKSVTLLKPIQATVLSDATTDEMWDHDQMVRTIFATLAGLAPEEVELVNKNDYFPQYYPISPTSKLIMRSYNDGYNNFFPYPDTYNFPDAQLVMPLFDNQFIEYPYYATPPWLVTCACSETTENDHTAYGVGLEFLDDDYGYGGDPIDVVSYAVPVIAAKLWIIHETLNCSWWEARFRARETASEAGHHSNTNGYGVIDVSAAIAYAGPISPDPYI